MTGSCTRLGSFVREDTFGRAICFLTREGKRSSLMRRAVVFSYTNDHYRKSRSVVQFAGNSVRLRRSKGLSVFVVGSFELYQTVAVILLISE